MSQDAEKRFRNDIMSELAKAQSELGVLTSDAIAKRWDKAVESASTLNWRINQLFLAVGRHAKDQKK